jgi:hypothetical protein
VDIIDELRKKVFGTVVLRGLSPRLSDEPPMSPKTYRERLKPSLVVMSRESAREIMRADYSNMVGILTPKPIGEPDRVFGIRVAYDESLQVGEFLVAETVA